MLLRPLENSHLGGLNSQVPLIPKNGSKEGSANHETDKDEAKDIFDSLKGAIDKVLFTLILMLISKHFASKTKNMLC